MDPGERDCAGVVIHDGHPYSMPPEAIGLPWGRLSIVIACYRCQALQCGARGNFRSARGRSRDCTRSIAEGE